MSVHRIDGLANCHSHAFHRALRGRTHAGGGSFWTWREQMYALAERLDPHSYRALALGVYAEMAAAGVTSVGEFHYLHHAPGGRSYQDPNAMGHALIDAAREVGIRIALLDACYLSSGFGEPPEGVQVRFSDGDADAWASRVEALAAAYDGAEDVRIGAAIHSVRAVPADQLPTVVAAASGRPLHAHLSEQPAENEACLAAHGLTPTALLAQAGALGPRTTLVHATHLSAADIDTIGVSGSHVCFCPTTERDLADGIGPARELVDAGARLTLGSDQHAVIDLFEEARAVELHERLRTGERGRFAPAELLEAATASGHASLGFARPACPESPDSPDSPGGQEGVDRVEVDAASLRTLGAAPEELVFAASAADVVRTVRDGRTVFDREAAPEDPASLAATTQRLVRGLAVAEGAR